MIAKYIIPFIIHVLVKTSLASFSDVLFRAVIYGTAHDDVFSLQCGLDGTMVLSIEDYPLANDRLAKFTEFKAGNCTEDNGIQVTEDGNSYDVTFDSTVCGISDGPSNSTDISTSAGVQMSAYYESADGETKFFQKTISLNAACNLKSTYTVEYIFKDIQKEEAVFPDAIQIIINFTLKGFDCPVNPVIIQQILALLYQILAELYGILDVVSIDDGCPETADARSSGLVIITSESGIPFSVGVIVEQGTATELEILEKIQELLDAATSTLNDNKLFHWVIDTDTTIIPNYVPEDDSLTQEFKFELTPMNENFTAEQEPSNEAGQMVYFKLEQTGSDMGEFLEYTVRNCKVISDENDDDDHQEESYMLYDESENDCGRSQVDAKLDRVSGNLFTFKYLLFLFSDGGSESNRSVYSLVCEVVLCVKSDADSVCKRVEDAC